MLKYKHFTGSDFEGMQQRMEKMLDNVIDEMRPTIRKEKMKKGYSIV